jgi:hypothetical protein
MRRNTGRPCASRTAMISQPAQQSSLEKLIALVRAILCTLPVCLLLTGCANHYDVTLRNGDVVRAVSKPKLNEQGYYVFKSAAGREEAINSMRIRQIEPVRKGSRPSSPFLQ